MPVDLEPVGLLWGAYQALGIIIGIIMFESGVIISVATGAPCLSSFAGDGYCINDITLAGSTFNRKMAAILKGH